MKFFASPLALLRRSVRQADDTANRIDVAKDDTSAGHRALAATPNPLLAVTELDDRVVVSLNLQGAVAPAELRSLGQQLIDLVQRAGARCLVVDLSGVSQLGSEALNQLIDTNCHARAAGTRLMLDNLSEPLLEVFRITRLDRLFDISEPT